MDSNVAKVFESYPIQYKTPLLQLRELIYAVAASLPVVGALDESLKWGQPSYVPKKAKTGTPIRIDRFGEDAIALFFHCQTNLVESFKTMFGKQLAFSKNRAIVLNPREKLPVKELTFCIEMALTYHIQK